MPAYQVGRLIVIVVGEPVTGAEAVGSTVVYARVSSADQRPDLDRQVARVTGWATGQHLSVDRVVTEVGSAVNGHRREFLAVLRDPKVSTIVVEQRTRSGGQVAVKRQPGRACARQTGTLPPHGESAMVASPRRSVVLADHTEVGNDHLAKFAGLEDIDVIIRTSTSSSPTRASSRTTRSCWV